MIVCVVGFLQTLPSAKVHGAGDGLGLGMLPRSVYMSDSMPNRNHRHRGGVVASSRPYMDTAGATSASAMSLGRPDIPSYALSSAVGGTGPVQSGTTPRRRGGGIFTTLGRTLRAGRSGGVPSTSAPNLGDIWLIDRPA